MVPVVRVLVTGGAGFIGSHVVDELVATGREVVALDALQPGTHGEPPSYLRDDVVNLRVDVRDPGGVAAALRGVDAVCHQAAMVGLGIDFGDVTGYVSNNDLGTSVLLEAMHRGGFRGPMVLASSMVVYGEGGYRCHVHGAVRPRPRTKVDLEAGRYEPRCPVCARALVPEPIGEDDATDPRNVYAATKLHQEHLCRAYEREHPETSVVALRYHNVYGPRMPRDTPYAGVASIVRSALERGDRPRVFEDGAQLRDFVHVTDVAHANALALESGLGGIFNVASGVPHSVGDMARALAAAFGPEAPAPIVTGEFRLGDVRHVTGAPGRARREIGFEARVGFEEGMAEFARVPLREPAPAGRDLPRAGPRRSRCEPRWRSGSGTGPRPRAGTP